MRSIEEYESLQTERDELINQFAEGNYDYILENINNLEFSEELIQAALQLSGRIYELNDKLREISNNAIYNILQDSILDIEKLKTWYGVINTLVSKYLLAETLFLAEEYESADAILHQIPSMFQLYEREIAEHNNYLLFHYFKKHLQLAERSWSNLNDGEIYLLQTIAEATRAGHQLWRKGFCVFSMRFVVASPRPPPKEREMRKFPKL